MRVLSIATARDSLPDVLRTISADADVAVIANPDGDDAVLMSLAYYQSLEATLHLLSTPHNAAALARAIEQDRAGQARPRDLATEQ